jgi:hypothetical protein
MPKPKQSGKACSIEETTRKVHNLYFYNVNAAWKGSLLIQSDEHWDNPHCDLKMLKKHHEEAAQRNAPIIKVGDVFCAMQGKYDKRSNKGDLRPEHQDGQYLDSLVDTASEWYAPYASQIALITPGNHELSILDRHETCLTTRLTEKLRSAGSPVRMGGYATWLRLHFIQPNGRPSCTPLTIFLHHGYGGGGPVTKGMIDFNRMVEQIEADVYIMGHVHYKNYNRSIRAYITRDGVEKERSVYYVRSGTYKDEFMRQDTNWHISKGRGPRPLGGWWMDLNIKHLDNLSRVPIIHFTEAD